MEREAIVDAVVAFGSAILFIAALVFVGVQFGDGGLTRTGGRLLVGVLVAFVVVMSVAGYGLSRRST